jgi:uncharacterized protein (TIGR00251 family)
VSERGRRGTLQAELRVRVQPRASNSEITGYRDGVLRVRLKSPPVDGRANEELCRLLARRLRLGRGRVEVVQGARSREKVLRVSGIAPEALRQALADLL